MSEDVRAGRMARADLRRAESAMIRSRGHCNTMGTASTMACVAEALGMTLPGNAGLPAADSRLLELAHAAGNRIVAMVAEDLRPGAILTAAALRNAVRAVAAVGGSTNAVVHLLAIARRVGAPVTLADIDAAGRGIPLLADIQPAGAYLMEDFHRAGGLDAVLGQIRDHLEPSRTVAGGVLTDQISGLPPNDPQVIRTADAPISPEAGLAVLRGNLAPDGAVIKPAAATPALMRHRGRAVVFDGVEDLHARLDDHDLDVAADDVLVLRGCGPRGYPGMPEVGNMPLPRKLLENGVRDMVRISDARMSGTAFGTVVLHVAPESAAGGPLGLVRTGDPIALDVEARRCTSTSPTPSSPAASRHRGRPARDRRLGAALPRARRAGRPGRGPGFPRRRARLGRRQGVPLSAEAMRAFVIEAPGPAWSAMCLRRSRLRARWSSASNGPGSAAPTWSCSPARCPTCTTAARSIRCGRGTSGRGGSPRWGPASIRVCAARTSPVTR